ncbi:MAG: hypothetical protein FJ351_07250 [Sphingomonadales bacterium]|nr:hypothetical protein [Sphingomonadales bacterium]
MMAPKAVVYTVFLAIWVGGLALLGACSDAGSGFWATSKAPSEDALAEDATCRDELASPKVAPMAAAMRAMLLQAETMRAYLISDSAQSSPPPAWAPMPFEKQTSTDSNVVTPDFLRRASDYHKAFEKVGREPTPEHFNAVVAQCVQCHESNCPGPIKRINRLRIEI